jgi:hypothetical protein
MTEMRNMNILTAVMIIILLLGAGFLLFIKYGSFQNRDVQITLPTTRSSANSGTLQVVVENTPKNRGVAGLPAGFPTSIPVEVNNIAESATTRYPAQRVQQLSLSYLSSMTINKKYDEYKNYLKLNGYALKEGSVSAPIRYIFGTKDNINLSVFISSEQGKTLIKLAYLLKTVQ